MRSVPVALAICAALSLQVGAVGAETPGGGRGVFQRWFTLLVESRYYAHKNVPDLVDGNSLVVWATRHALAGHDGRWMKDVELPVFPAIPPVPESVKADALNPRLVSKTLADAEPGDLLVFNRPGMAARMMVYIGSSQVVPSPRKWVVYIAGDRPHKVPVESLREDPLVEWRPVAENPYFMGVYRLEVGAGR